MAIMGYCHDCAAWVALGADWSCPMGHPAARVNGWYDSETGASVVPSDTTSGVPSAQPAPTAGTRAGLLADLMHTVSADHGYQAQWGSDTDMVIASNPVDGRWGVGKKRAEYAAALKVVESERTVYFWEMLKEQSQGLGFGTFEVETYSTSGAKRSGSKKESVVGPGANSWEWGYGTLRRHVEDVAARHGMTVHVVLQRRSAAW